jgi:hypothetical protein
MTGDVSLQDLAPDVLTGCIGIVLPDDPEVHRSRRGRRLFLLRDGVAEAEVVGG